jgi:coatomer subunit delta
MTRARIESLLASFPKLIPTNTQHTSVETSEVRYVYQPLEDLYILLITNKASNILQDIDTLHLFARVVSDMCRTADEREILQKSFEILGAFDEVVSMGYREQVNLVQVRSVLEMESHEEKIQEIIARVRIYGCTTFGLCTDSLAFLRVEQRSRGQRRAQTPC